jgi:hypothetical protein
VIRYNPWNKRKTGIPIIMNSHKLVYVLILGREIHGYTYPRKGNFSSNTKIYIQEFKWIYSTGLSLTVVFWPIKKMYKVWQLIYYCLSVIYILWDIMFLLSLFSVMLLANFKSFMTDYFWLVSFWLWHNAFYGTFLISNSVKLYVQITVVWSFLFVDLLYCSIIQY